MIFLVIFIGELKLSLNYYFIKYYNVILNVKFTLCINFS